MLEFLAKLFAKHPDLAIFFVSLLPTIESRTAIPFGLSKQIWEGQTLSPIWVGLISFFGSMLPAFFVIIFARWLKNKASGFVFDKFTQKLQSRISKHFDKFSQKENAFKKCLFLVGFVALPLPLTGVYTGCLIAGFSKLKIWQCFVSVLVGEIISCVCLTILCAVFDNSAFYILLFSFGIAFLFLLVNFLIWLKVKLTSQHKNQ